LGFAFSRARRPAICSGEAAVLEVVEDGIAQGLVAVEL
jgi:hypothetical protein